MIATTRNGGRLRATGIYMVVPVNPLFFTPQINAIAVQARVAPAADGWRIDFFSLPELSDSKSASYSGENIPGRSSPMVNYSHSEPRTISLSAPFHAQSKTDLLRNIFYCRLLDSATHPRLGNTSVPHRPPPVCRIFAGQALLGGATTSLGQSCVVIRSRSFKYPTDVVWDTDLLFPYRVDVTIEMEVVYSSAALPNQELIFNSINTLSL